MILEKIPEEKKVENNIMYLHKKINDDCAFFVYNKKLCLGVRSSRHNPLSLDRKLIRFEKCLGIVPNCDENSIEAGNFDLLFYKGDESDEYYDMFIDLCFSFLNSENNDFDKFVLSLDELFKYLSSEDKMDLIGLYGELIFLYSLYIDYNANLTPFWHINGKFSKYDIMSERVNVEIKTTTTQEQHFKIKHSQLFNGLDNYVCVVSITESNLEKDLSLLDLLMFFKNDLYFSKNLRFQIEINKYLIIAKNNPSFEIKYSVIDIQCYRVLELDTVKDIPLNISNLVYDYKFPEEKAIQLKEFSKYFNQ